jgi:hypothetical protein
MHTYVCRSMNGGENSQMYICTYVHAGLYFMLSLGGDLKIFILNYVCTWASKFHPVTFWTKCFVFGKIPMTKFFRTTGIKTHNPRNVSYLFKHKVPMFTQRFPAQVSNSILSLGSCVRRLGHTLDIQVFV